MLAPDEKLKAEQPHGVLVILQHLGVWSWAERIASAGVPTIVFSSLGTSFTQHVQKLSWQKGAYVLSGLDFAAVEQAMRMIRAKRMFEEARVLVVRGDQRSETVLELLGTKVRYVPRRLFREWFDEQPVTDEVRSVVAEVRKSAKKIVEPDQQDLLNAARAYVTAKRLMKAEQANAITMDCLGMVSSKVMPTPPCLAWSLLQDQGGTGGCEADLFGCLSLMFSSYVFGKPGFMNDPVACRRVRTSFEIKMHRMEDARDVLGFHQVVFYGDHRREVAAFCQLYDLEAVHSPKRHVAT